MKILWRKRGFTTNSSGSYEWLPNGLMSSSSASTTGQLPTTTPAASASLVGRFDILILIAAVLTGVAALSLLAKEIYSNSTKKKDAGHPKRHR
jgi:hypothetical protein